MSICVNWSSKEILQYIADPQSIAFIHYMYVFITVLLALGTLGWKYIWYGLRVIALQ